MEIVDLTDDVLPKPEIRMYEHLGNAWSIKVLSSEKTDQLREGDKFTYNHYIYEIKRKARTRSSPTDYFDFTCLQVGKAD